MKTVSTVISTVSYSDYSFINRVILPGGGRKYSGIHSRGLVWLKNKKGDNFPNHFLRRDSNIIVLYAHGNGGSLGDFKSAVLFYGRNLNVSFFAVEYPCFDKCTFGSGRGNNLTVGIIIFKEKKILFYIYLYLII